MKIHGSLLKERKRSLLTDKSNKKISIIGIGESDMDLFLKVDRMPGRGEKVRAKEIGKLPGGIIGNFCSQAVKMGVSCGIVTAVLCEVNSYAKSLPEPLVLWEIRQLLLCINFSILQVVFQPVDQILLLFLSVFMNCFYRYAMLLQLFFLNPWIRFRIDFRCDY